MSYALSASCSVRDRTGPGLMLADAGILGGWGPPPKLGGPRGGPPVGAGDAKGAGAGRPPSCASRVAISERTAATTDAAGMGRPDSNMAANSRSF
jgi:hypothetical protein